MNAILIVLAFAAVANAAPQTFHHGFNSVSTPQILPNGHLADTPEVQAAKANHFAEVAKAINSATPTHFQSDAAFFAPPVQTFYVPVTSYQSLSNPSAGVVVSPQGYLADTAEVAKAKAVHYAALASAVGAPTDPYTRYLANFS